MQQNYDAKKREREKSHNFSHEISVAAAVLTQKMRTRTIAMRSEILCGVLLGVFVDEKGGRVITLMTANSISLLFQRYFSMIPHDAKNVERECGDWRERKLAVKPYLNSVCDRHDKSRNSLHSETKLNIINCSRSLASERERDVDGKIEILRSQNTVLILFF